MNRHDDFPWGIVLALAIPAGIILGLIWTAGSR